LEREYPALRRKLTISPAASPRLRGLIQEQIKVAQQQLTESKKKIEVGVQPLGSELPYRQALVHLQRDLASTEEASGGPKQRQLLEEEIQIAELNVKHVKREMDNGKAANGAELEPQRELLALRRELAEYDTGANERASGFSGFTQETFKQFVAAKQSEKQDA